MPGPGWFCQPVRWLGMFNVLIIGCSVVYISLSAALSHPNCQSTSKACGVIRLPPDAPPMFSLS